MTRTSAPSDHVADAHVDEVGDLLLGLGANHGLLILEQSDKRHGYLRIGALQRNLVNPAFINDWKYFFVLPPF